LHERPEVAARTRFATHYHELNAMADRLERVHNYRIQVSEHEGEIVFLRTLIPGGADHSYGIEVAKMAGLPDAVIARAREVLHNLESQHLEVGDGDTGDDSAPPSGDGMHAKKGDAEAVPDLEDSQANQMHLFAQPDPVAEEIKDMLSEINPNRITPVEALMKLSEMKDKLQE
jgi:DNA mismatch repair protein MutS